MKDFLQAVYARGHVTKFIDDPAMLAQKLDRDYVPLKMFVYNKDGSTTNIKLENIFIPLETEHNRGVQKILIDGRAGSGKSTTLEELLHLYSINAIPFEYVFRVKLKALQDSNWKENYEAKDKRDNLLACFIHASVMKLKEDNGIEQSLSVDEDKLLQDIIKALKSSNTLILVDGYEDIQHLIRHDEGVKNIINQIMKPTTNHVVMTVRSNSLDSLTKNYFDRKIGLEGFDSKGIKSYVEKFFNNLKDILTEEVNKYFTEYLDESKIADGDIFSLLDYLKTRTNEQSNGAYYHISKVIGASDAEQNVIIEKINQHCDSKKIQLLNLLNKDKAVKELASNPINAAILCIVFSDKEIEVNHPLTLEKLYNRLIEWLATRFEYKATARELDIDADTVLKALQEIAYKSLDKERLFYDIIAEVLEKYQLSIDVVNQFGVLKMIGGMPTEIHTPEQAVRVISEKAGDVIEHQTSGPGQLKRSEHKSQRFSVQPNEDLRGKDFEFIHKSVLEYLAASEFASLLSHPDKGDIEAKKAAEFIASHRYESQYLMFIKFITGMLINSDSSIGVKRLFEALTCNIDGECKLGIDNDVKLLTHVLSQAWRANDEDEVFLDSKIPNLKKLVSIIDYVAVNKLPTAARMIADSGYVSPNIIGFLFSQIENRKIEPDSTVEIRRSSVGTKDVMTNFEEVIIETLALTSSSSEEVKNGSHASQEEDYDISYSPTKRTKYASMTDSDVAPAILAIKTIASLLDKLDTKVVFEKLSQVLVPSEAWQVKKMAIYTLTKMLETQQVQQSLLDRFKEILVSEAVSHKMLSNVVRYALKILNEETIIVRSESFPEIGIPDVEVSNEIKDEILGLSLSKVIQRLKNDANKAIVIKILIENLSTHWLENNKLQRMDGLLELLNYSSDDSNDIEVSGLRTLSECTKKLLQIQISNMNDSTDILWFNSHFDSLTKNLTPKVIEWVFLQIISDGELAPDEVVFVQLCITRLGFSLIIGEPEITYSFEKGTEYKNFITYNGVKYTLFGEQNHLVIKEMLQALEKEKASVVSLESILEEMNIGGVVQEEEEAQRFIIENSGSGIKIAASDILKSHSIITSQEISANDKVLVSFVYYTDHKKTEPNDVFVVVELKEKIFGKHVVYKILINSRGEIDVYPYTAHPDEVGSIARTILGAMQYTEVKPKYYTSSFVVDVAAATDKEFDEKEEEININGVAALIKGAPGYRPEVKVAGKTLIEKSVTFVRRSHDHETQAISLTTADKAKLLHSLLMKFIPNFSSHNISGDWQQDGLSRAFVERGRELVGSIEVNYQDSFRINQNDMKQWQEQVNIFMKKVDINMLVNLIDKEHQSKKAQKEMIAIEADAYKYELYKGIVQAMNSVYIAAQAINSEMVQSISDGNLALTGGVLKGVSKHVPFGLSAAVEFIGDIFNAADDIKQSHNIENYMEFALNSEKMTIISDKVARKFIELKLDSKDIKDSSLGVLASAGKAVHNVVKNGPAAAIVNLCVMMREEAVKTETEEDAQKQLGKDHAKIVSKIIIESIFRGEYDKTYARKTEGRASDIIKFVVKKLSENVEHKVSGLDNHDVGISGKYIVDEDAEEKEGDSWEITGGSKDVEDDHIAVRSSEDTVKNPKKLGCTGGHCIVMAVRDVEYDNFLLRTPEGRELLEYTRKFHGAQVLDQMLKIGEDEGATEAILEHARKINIKIALDDNWQELVQTAEVLYGQDAAEALIESSRDSEYTEMLLEEAKLPGGIEKVLKILFGATSETAIKNFKTIIAVEDDRDQGGLLKYFWNAAAGNKYAQQLIDDVNYLYTKVQELVLAGKDMGTKFLLLKSQLEFLLDFAESGQLVPIFYRPGGPGDDHDGDGAGGGGGGVFFEGGGDNQDSSFVAYPVSIGVNVTLIMKGVKALEDSDFSM